MTPAEVRNIQPGTIVKWVSRNKIKKWHQGAKNGATATVIKFDGEYLRIKWIRTNPLCGNQMDGGYGYSGFEIIKHPIGIKPPVIGLCDECGGINQHEVGCH